VAEIRLPGPGGKVVTFHVPEPVEWLAAIPGAALSRVALSAAHVVADPLADVSPDKGSIDIEATVAYRQYLWGLGLGVAEAMDTAQRGMGLDWPTAQVLIRETLAAARSTAHAVVFAGAGTDQLATSSPSVDDVIRAYDEQISFVQKLGGRVIVMASRALVRAAPTAEDYARVYRAILANLDRPAIIHWLGPMFDPALGGYWGEADVERAMEACLGILHDNAARIDGIKVSLLDKDVEKSLRHRLPSGMRMYTGDDFNYPELIEGDGAQSSDALLGIFDPIAPAASAALLALTLGDARRFRAILDPTVQLSREIFDSPTRFYKTGVVFLAYLNQHQSHFIMLGGQQGARALPHLVRVFKLGAGLGLLRDPDQAVHRMRAVLALHGFEG
jgi:hypothetical protein